MRALLIDKDRIHLVGDRQEPQRPEGWALIKPRLVGICGTDLELLRGYRQFSGVPGHEFVGEVVEADSPLLLGKRVVGEINIGCTTCQRCRSGMTKHCGRRRVLGIDGIDGCFADRFVLPVENLHTIPDSVTDEQAVFTEPLAAAFEIAEQVHILSGMRIVVLGAGKMGTLCAWVLAKTAGLAALVGHHPEVFQKIRYPGVETAVPESDLADADLVVEATGSATGLEAALRLVRPRGTIVMKSTIAGRHEISLTPLVTKEITVVGSRCGPFRRALNALATGTYPVENLIEGRYPIERAEEAFKHAATRGVMKVLLTFPE
ncbi:MAG TPA: alcohol dehydrogenase catalytic domain-containing protein [Candidatus Ozemobacteraceae bacterium]|nr:alcohol dehydrogenase catalytic domain-containing protein [Candidatus Ozemobacteraceae bacterium]